jgi:hypothetical protein
MLVKLIRCRHLAHRGRSIGESETSVQEGTLLTPLVLVTTISVDETANVNGQT